jgi:hypothetical protein
MGRNYINTKNISIKMLKKLAELINPEKDGYEPDFKVQIWA